MSRQYKNIKLYLEQNDYKMITPYDTYIENKKQNKFKTIFKYQCPSGHIKEINTAAFINKKSQIKKTNDNLCSDCKKGGDNYVKLQELQKKVKETGYTILTYNNNKDITYKCGNCNYIGHTTSVNLLRVSKTKYCIKCQNDKNKLIYENIKKRIESHDMKLLTKKDEYKNNKQKLYLTCKCGKNFYMKLHDVERGRSCMLCKNNKSENVCRDIFEELTGKKFQSNIRPSWLNRLELDGYNEELGLAFEYNGIQHYVYNPDFFHRKGIHLFEEQKERDQRKLLLCEERGIKLIIISFNYSYKDKDKMKGHIKDKLDKHFLTHTQPLTVPIIQNSIQTFPDGITIIEFMAEYSSTQEASRVTGIPEDRIKTICDGEECGVDDAYHWEYKE